MLVKLLMYNVLLHKIVRIIKMIMKNKNDNKKKNKNKNNRKID